MNFKTGKRATASNMIEIWKKSWIKLLNTYSFTSKKNHVNIPSLISPLNLIAFYSKIYQPVKSRLE
ncbi:MAG: hypothetical protein ACTSXP_14200 [Promethearchaeota archaeon]